ncbi:MAG: hypothetical protein R2848_01205 [Thermomicrobiales bacterium]
MACDQRVTGGDVRLDQLEAAARRLAEQGAQEIVFACTSGSLVNGVGWDWVIAERIGARVWRSRHDDHNGRPCRATSAGCALSPSGPSYIAEVDERGNGRFSNRPGLS